MEHDLYLLVPPVHPLSKEYHFHNPIARVAEIQVQPSVPLRRESEVPSLDTPCSPQHEKKKEFHSLANLLRFDLIQFLQSKHNFEAIVAERHTFFDFALHLYKTKLCRFPDALFYTPKYLSKVIKDACGKNPSTLINEYTMEHIKYQLRNSDKSIKEIAEEFNFPNQSFFGKYVKAHLGVSPQQYRDKKEK